MTGGARVTCAVAKAGPAAITDAPDAQDGVATVALPLLVWFVTVLSIVLIDLGGYLVAASRAQTLADGAALAAVSAHVSAAPSRAAPVEAAGAVVTNGGGRLESCVCPVTAGHARVTVSLPAPGLVMPRLGAGRVEAEATAMLAPPDDLAPGPTRERSRWRRPPLATD